MSDNGPPNFWDYQARRAEKEAKREAKVQRKTVDLEQTRDVWSQVEVKEHRLSDTGLQRFINRVKTRVGVGK
jgi:hypothetical protein